MLRCLAHALAVALLTCCGILADEPNEASLQRAFEREVRPFLARYCFECHGESDPEAKLDLTIFRNTEQVRRLHQTWREIKERVHAKEMPSTDSSEQPTDEERQRFVAWIQSQRDFFAKQHAGDPGTVLARRLNNAEFNYTVRDLTGVDIRPTRAFPVDPANEAGFDNSGESLSMSPALLKKYLGAAREISDHLVLTPEGMHFAPHPVVTLTDRDKYCVKRIVQFYERQPIDLAEYFLACWLIRTAGPAEAGGMEAVARSRGLSLKYLKQVATLLLRDQEELGPTQRLRTLWESLPREPGEQAAALEGCRRMADFVQAIRPKLNPFVENLSGAGVHKGSQTFVLWKNRQYAAHRTTFQPDVLQSFGRLQDMKVDGFEVSVPKDAEELRRYEQAMAEFCATFPDRFYVSERGRDYLDKPNPYGEKGRLLSAGFHSMMGYFRDDQPLYDLILSEAEQQEIDGLWDELNYVASAPMRQYSSFVWFERTDSGFMRDPEFDFARAEDKSVTEESMIRRLGKVYLAKVVHQGGDGEVVQAVEEYFRNINDEIRRVELQRREAEPKHLRALLSFAARAYRRSLSEAEELDLQAYYHNLRQDGLSHDVAMQDCVVALLMSPHFCYRLDLLGDGDQTRPLDADELASRLSYFLWSSMPDDALFAAADSGQLTNRDALLGQVDRMLDDERVVGLAREFAGHWLDFRRFEEHNSVDRERFSQFDDSLRQAMFEEPVRFFVRIVKENRSVKEFLFADWTMVNGALAKHYGVDVDSPGWYRLEDANQIGRGGLLPMAVFLTKNSPGLRTSPVKRGYWVVRQLLGEHIPAPPPDVPDLPEDESQLGDRTLRDVLKSHREHPNCAACHERFDSIGLVFEGYGPIGGRRTLDLGGRMVETDAVFPDGSTGDGVEGLRDYVATREDEFVENLCRKFLAYALGRTLLLTDEQLVQDMMEQLKQDDYRFRSLTRKVVTSRQFLHKRTNSASRE